MSSSASEEENYWPGYVDALTTMTMVLTFIMMVLGVVVFVLSQEVGRKNLTSIALAMGIVEPKGSGDGKGSAEGLTSAILQALTQRVKNGDFPAPPPKERSDAPSQLAAVPLSSGKGFAAVDALTPSWSLAAPVAEPPKAEPPAPAEPPSAATVDVQASLSPPARIDNASPADVTARSGASTAVQRDAEFVLGYKGLAVRLDQAAADAVRTFAGRHDPDTVFEIRGYAASTGASITEARRTAYYRAMGARNALVELGVKPDKIKVQVLDTDAAVRNDTVAIITR
jgi:hypothetical protein